MCHGATTVGLGRWETASRRDAVLKGSAGSWLACSEVTLAATEPDKR